MFEPKTLALHLMNFHNADADINQRAFSVPGLCTSST